MKGATSMDTQIGDSFFIRAIPELVEEMSPIVLDDGTTHTQGLTIIMVSVVGLLDGKTRAYVLQRGPKQYKVTEKKLMELLV